MVTVSRRYLVLHGWQNRRSPAHWQHWLATRLRRRGEEVRYPQLPDTDAPSPARWLEVLRSELDQLGSGERIVVCHSLACWLWLRHADTATAAQRVTRLLLVAPPGLSARAPEIQAFKPPALDAAALARTVSAGVELVCSDSDQWCPEGCAGLYGPPLRTTVHVLPGAGHIAIDDGYGPWPAVESWALTGEFAAVGVGVGVRTGA